MPVAGVVEYVDAGTKVLVEFVVAGTTPGRTVEGVGERAAAVERPAVRPGQRPYRPHEIGIPHDDRVDVLPVYDFECSEQATGELVVDREVSRPDLRPLELGIHRVHVERLRERGGIAGASCRPQRTRREEVRIGARVRDHVADPYERHA